MSENIKTKAISSTKWLIILNLLGNVCLYIATVLLARVSDEMLGQYTIISVFINFCSSCVCIGGATVLGKYIPRASDVSEKSGILKAYMVVNIVSMFLAISICMLWPSVFTYIVGETDKKIKSILLFVLLPICVVQSACTYFLLADFKAKAAQIISNLYKIVLPVILLVYIYGLNMKTEGSSVFIMFIMIFLYGIMLIADCVYIYVTKKFTLKSKVGYPHRFFIFSFFSTLQSIMVFLNTNVDKLLLANIDSIAALGRFQAVLQIDNIIRLIPNQIGNVTVPFFSSVMQGDSVKSVRNTYRKMELLFLLFLFTVSFGTIAISDFLLGIFGEEYQSCRIMVIIFAVSNVISSRGYLNTPMMINLEKDKLRLLNSCIQIFVQFFIALYLIKEYGILAIVLGRVIGALIAQIIPSIVVKKSNYNIGIPKEYFIVVAFTVIYGVGVCVFDLNSIAAIISGIIIYIITFYLAGFKVKEIIKFLRDFLGIKHKNKAE